MFRKHARPSIGHGLGLAVALASALLVAAPAAAAPAQHDGTITHREVHTEYYPDDICGPRAGWTTTVVTSMFQVTEHPEGSYTFSFVEVGTYHTDFDDPSIASYDSRFTGATHGTLTPGGTQIYTSEWRDFPGSITIHEQVRFVQVGDEVKIDSDILRVDGCP